MKLALKSVLTMLWLKKKPVSVYCVIKGEWRDVGTWNMMSEVNVRSCKLENATLR